MDKKIIKVYNPMGDIFIHRVKSVDITHEKGSGDYPIFCITVISSIDYGNDVIEELTISFVLIGKDKDLKISIKDI